MKRIVVGFDGSEHAHKALERAAEIAGGATLAIVAAANVTRSMRGAGARACRPGGCRRTHKGSRRGA